MKNAFLGEFIGTFMMILFGCGSVAVTVLFGSLMGQLQIAVVWGVSIALAIYATRNICCAHFNPAVSVSMVLSGRMAPQKLPVYLAGQLSGAFAGSLLVYGLFAPSIRAYEQTHGIVRGTFASVATAKIFGEYYRQPGSSAQVGMGLAAAAELVGTFILVFVIFCLTENCNVGKPDSSLQPLFIGLTVTIIQCIIAPLTQAGLNPARDFMPRLVALMGGWKFQALPDTSGGFFWVYILAPIVGGILAGMLFTKVIEPSMKKENQPDMCCCEGKKAKVGERIG